MDYSNQLLINDLGYHVVSGDNLFVQTLAPTATLSEQIRESVALALREFSELIYILYCSHYNSFLTCIVIFIYIYITAKNESLF